MKKNLDRQADIGTTAGAGFLEYSGIEKKRGQKAIHHIAPTEEKTGTGFRLLIDLSRQRVINASLTSGVGSR